MKTIKTLRSGAAKVSLAITLVLIALGLSPLGQSKIDVQSHDFYFLLDYRFVLLVLAFFFLTLAALYEICYSWLTVGRGGWINSTNLAINALCFIFIGVGKFTIGGQPRHYSTFSNFETFNNFNRVTQVLSIVIIFFLISNLIFGCYFLFCLIRKLISL